jgi:hypothetical protein
MSVFPYSPVLDDFNRANAATLGAAWSPFGQAGNDAGIINNTAYDANNTWNLLYWNAGTFGPNSEMYSTQAALITTDGDTFEHFIRMKDMVPGAFNYDGYTCTWYRQDASNHFLQIKRIDNSAATQLGPSITITPTAGDSYGIEAIGDTISAYEKAGSGAWTWKGGRTDSTYAAAGYIGFGFPNEANWRLDDFGGGATAPVDVHMAYRVAYKSLED